MFHYVEYIQWDAYRPLIDHMLESASRVHRSWGCDCSRGHWSQMTSATGQSVCLLGKCHCFQGGVCFRGGWVSAEMHWSKSSFPPMSTAKEWQTGIYISTCGYNFVAASNYNDSDSNPDSNPFLMSCPKFGLWIWIWIRAVMKVHVKRVLLPQIWDLIDTEKRFKGMTNSH